ncbi:MAG: hypothetical protein IPL23_15435 [Saprospiraceae bacterium]|nr:hypothetical protein [Saprospiraceae bacterium]
MIRAIIAILSGLIAGMAAIFLGLMVLSGLYPNPEYLDPMDADKMNLFINSLPDNAFIIKALTHIIACFAAGLVGALISRPFKIQSGIIAAILIYILVIYRDFRFVYPTAYVVSDLALCAIIGFAAVMIGSNR